MSAKSIDLLVVVLISLIGFRSLRLAAPIFDQIALVPALIYTTLIIVYLSLRETKPWLKLIVVMLLIGGLAGFIFEFLIEFNRAYMVNSHVLPMAFGFMAIDAVAAHMAMTLLTVIMYVHFIEPSKNNSVPKFVWLVMVTGLLIITALITLFYWRPEYLQIQYPYFYLGLLATLMPLLFLATKPKNLKKLAILVFGFFVLYFVSELIAVDYDWWTYPGDNYIKFISVLGRRFPIEELLFWMLVYPLTIVSYYKLFIDSDH